MGVVMVMMMMPLLAGRFSGRLRHRRSVVRIPSGYLGILWKIANVRIEPQFQIQGQGIKLFGRCLKYLTTQSD